MTFTSWHLYTGPLRWCLLLATLSLWFAGAADACADDEKPTETSAASQAIVAALAKLPAPTQPTPSAPATPSTPAGPLREQIENLGSGQGYTSAPQPVQGGQPEPIPPGMNPTPDFGQPVNGYAMGPPPGCEPCAVPRGGGIFHMNQLDFMRAPDGQLRMFQKNRARHRGIGEPLVGTSWMNRPYHVGWFFGGIGGSNILDDQLKQGTSIFGGYRIGWENNHYTGCELRFGFSYIPIDYSYANGPPQLTMYTNRYYCFDFHYAYYPLGDSRWRPFLSIGFGMDTVRFSNEQGRLYNRAMFAIPLSIGMKYQLKNWLAIRCELMDDVSFGDDRIGLMNCISFTGGVEIRYGSRRNSYFPWDPAIR